MRTLSTLCFALVLTGPSLRGQYEVGAGIGGSFYNNRTLTNPSGSANAGFSPGVSGTVFGYENIASTRFSGGLRYTYGSSELKLEGNGRSATFGADSHTLTFDLFYHLASRESRLRPYILTGGGFKYYRGIGTERTSQTLGNIALLTKTNDFNGIVSVGGGVKYQLTNLIQLRAEFRDDITPFPKVIQPIPGTRGSASLHNFIPWVGIAITP